MNEVDVDNKWVEEPGTEDEVLDPMSAEYAPGLSLVVLMRIYEVQLAILREANPEAAAKLLELHSNGVISTPMPYVDAEASAL